MKINSHQTGSAEVRAILLGGGIGLLVGVVMGVGVASLAGAFANNIGWFVVLHVGFAMMLMGGWSTPSLMGQHGENAYDHGATNEDHGIVMDCVVPSSSEQSRAA